MKCERCGRPVNGLDICSCYIEEANRDRDKIIERLRRHIDKLEADVKYWKDNYYLLSGSLPGESEFRTSE